MKGTAQVPWDDIERHKDEQRAWVEKRKDEWNRIRNTQPKLADALLLQHRLEQHWWLLVADYSGRLLTEKTDKLIALSGAARAYQEEHFPKGGVKYGAGLWSCHLPEGLLWSVTGLNETSRPERYIAPSWSWAAVKENVRYELGADIDRFKREISQPAVGQGQEQEERSLPLSLTDQVRDELKVEEMTVSLKYDDPYGALNDASLILSGARMVEVDSITQALVHRSGYMDLYRNGVDVGSLTLMSVMVLRRVVLC